MERSVGAPVGECASEGVQAGAVIQNGVYKTLIKMPAELEAIVVQVLRLPLAELQGHCDGKRSSYKLKEFSVELVCCNSKGNNWLSFFQTSILLDRISGVAKPMHLLRKQLQWKEFTEGNIFSFQHLAVAHLEQLPVSIEFTVALAGHGLPLQPTTQPTFYQAPCNLFCTVFMSFHNVSSLSLSGSIILSHAHSLFHSTIHSTHRYVHDHLHFRGLSPCFWFLKYFFWFLLPAVKNNLFQLSFVKFFKTFLFIEAGSLPWSALKRDMHKLSVQKLFGIHQT